MRIAEEDRWKKAVFDARTLAFDAILETTNAVLVKDEETRKTSLEFLRGWRDCTEWLIKEAE